MEIIAKQQRPLFRERSGIHLRRFAADETAAVTADWVVLTATVVCLSAASIALIANGITGFTIDIGNSLEESGGATPPEAPSDAGAQGAGQTNTPAAIAPPNNARSARARMHRPAR